MAEKLIEFEQANAVVEFSKALYAGEQYGFWSPFLSNQLMQGLNNNAKTPSADKLRQALGDYLHTADTIQSYMEFTKFWDMIFSRTVQSYINALSFDLQTFCTNAYTQADFESEEYKQDKARVNEFLNKFAYKNEFRKVVQQIMLHEAYFVSFRKTKWGNKGMKFALQPLPQQYCLMDGYWEKGILFSFDLSYFLQAGTDLSLYDPAMTKAYERVFGTGANVVDYRPSVPLNERTGTYAMYSQLSPQDGFFCFKFDSSNFNTTPFLAPFMKDALTNDEIQQLQTNKDIVEAYAILAGEIATFDNAKSGTQADQMVFNPKTLGGFMSKVKSGLSSMIKVAAMPVKNLGWYQYKDENPEMYTTQITNTAAIGTGASRSIVATDRMSNAEMEAAQNETYQTMRPLYYQFGNFLDFYVNKLTTKYKFRFVFDGSNYNFERKERFDRLKQASEKGISLSSSVWSSVLGIEPQLFEASMLESKNGGWTDNLQLMLNTNTTSGDAGRPQKQGMVDDSTERNEDV